MPVLKRFGTALAVAMVLGSAASWPLIEAADVSASARVYGGPTRSDERQEDLLDERYSLRLFQPITPWLSIALSHRYNRFTDDVLGGGEFERRSSQPLVELRYRRSNVSARLSYRERRNRGTFETDTLNVETFLGDVTWRPRIGPSYTVRYRDSSNLADIAVFGRDSQTKSAEFFSNYERGSWTARYSFRRWDLDNKISDFSLERTRHTLRLDFDDRYWQDKVAFSMNTWISSEELTEETPENAMLADPIPIREGLFAVDTDPTSGVLDPAPDLVDGDRDSPVSPSIEIGGDNRFRNIGVDLGFTRQVTRLEITVDNVSDPNLVWEVYHSSDNLTTAVWTAVPVDEIEWDGALLRYTLHFAETTDRFFKAVNVSNNAISIVSVTEVRALVDVERLVREEETGRATRYRSDLTTSFRPTDRVGANLSLGFSDIQNSGTGLGGRESQEHYYSAAAHVDLSEELTLRGGYRIDNFEEDVEPVLARETRLAQASLDWLPLPALRSLFSFSRRDEYDRDERLRTADELSMRVTSQLLPDLRLVSVLAYDRVDDPFSGVELTGWKLRETLESRPTRTWTLSGSVSQTWYDVTGGAALESRTNAQVSSSWRAAPFLSLRGSWTYGKDDRQESISQRYSLSWAPGRKLSGSVNYQNFDSPGVRRTTTASARLSYRLNRHLNVYTTLSNSRFFQVVTGRSETTSVRYGLSLNL